MSGRRCDFCKAPNAPFGYGPPPHLGIKVRRSIWACAAPSCRAQGEARRDALVAGHDPLQRAREARQAAPAAPAPPGPLFGR